MTLAALLVMASSLCAQVRELQETPKSGLSVAGTPILGYDSSRGLELGLLANLYDFGKDTRYPNPRQNLYVQAAWYLKGSQRFVLYYDNNFLIPTVRFTFEAEYTNDQEYDFYGFGGYESYYDASLPAAYYKISNKTPAAKLDFTGKIKGNLYWKFGYNFKYFIIDGYQGDLSQLPYGLSLFDWYKWLGLIEYDEFNGGMSSSWRAGLSYDSRDAENSPTRGLWVDLGGEYAPGWMGTNKPFGRYDFTWRHYVPLHGGDLVLAYRASVQGFIGKPGFYMLPFNTCIGTGYDRSGFGGYNTIRGVLRNRIQGQAVCFFNTELRWKFYNTVVLGQNVSLGANLFFDGGRVLQDYADVSEDPAPWTDVNVPSQLFNGTSESFHLSAGAGLRFILNRNFIISLDYGRAFNSQDNHRGALYLNTGYLF